jgi:hypothetical protein
MKKRTVNPPLSDGDRIELYYMDGESSVPMGTEGTVVSISNDPFDDSDSKIIHVKWDNGSQLSLCSEIDLWKFAREKKLDEQVDGEGSSREYEFFGKNEELFDSFDWRFLNKYLKVIQKTGIVNMFGAGFTLYCGSDHLERYYGEDREDDDSFQEALEMADEAKNKMIQGTVNWMEKNNKEVTVDSVNTYIKRLSVKIIELYATFY